MAFSFDTFAKDQKQSAIDIVDTITPSQVKQVGAAYKAGLNASPKQVINETLESFTGIDLSQGAGVDGLGAAAKNFIQGQAATLTMQLEQQILGCINTAIRDLMNKVPAIDFILNFEDRINGILGKFRNKLEQKIDAELRKLTYQKLKVHQLALFKQRIAGKIKDICPASTPASVAEVQDFNNKIKGLFSKRSIDNTVTDTTNTLTTDNINEAKVEVKTQVATPFEGISNKRKQTFQQDPVETKKIVDEKVAQTKAEVDNEVEAQLEKKDDETIEGLVHTEPTEDDVYVAFYYKEVFNIPLAMIERGTKGLPITRKNKITENIRKKLQEKRSGVHMFIANGYDAGLGKPPWVKKQLEEHTAIAIHVSEQLKDNNVVSYKIKSKSYDGSEVVMEYGWDVLDGKTQSRKIVSVRGTLTLAATTYKAGAKAAVKQIEQIILSEAVNKDYSA
jgi:hypothetical protein